MQLKLYNQISFCNLNCFGKIMAHVQSCSILANIWPHFILACLCILAKFSPTLSRPAGLSWHFGKKSATLYPGLSWYFGKNYWWRQTTVGAKQNIMRSILSCHTLPPPHRWLHRHLCYPLPPPLHHHHQHHHLSHHHHHDHDAHRTPWLAVGGVELCKFSIDLASALPRDLRMIMIFMITLLCIWCLQMQHQIQCQS